MSIRPSVRTTNFRYAIRDVVSVAERLKRSGQSIISLNIGDPQAFGFRPPDHVIEPVTRALREGFTGYASSSGLFEAKEAVAEYATALRANTTPDDVIMTSGASEAADLVLTALVDEGDEVLLPAPGYPLYEAILNKLGANARHYLLHDDDNWQPSIEEIGALVDRRTKAIVLINPNNPTGSIISRSKTTEILEVAAAHDLLVISDEVYGDLFFDKPPVPASVIAEAMGLPLITLESLSKTHMLSGWRVGWMRFTHPEKIEALVRAIHSLASGRLCSPTPAQYAVKPALEGDRTFLSEFISEIRQRRAFANAVLTRTPGLSYVRPDAAFYLMIKADDPQNRTDERFVMDLLEQTGVLVVHGSGFGCDPNDRYFRMVYLADEKTLGQAFEKIGGFLRSKAAWV
jgi:alanine-synthesizing transaminase